ncbi:MAG: DUF4282 domain-containing protein [Thermodesulfobacteriota bacterium]
MYCTNCGTLNEDDKKLCIQCGESLTETAIKKKSLAVRLLKKAGFLQNLFDLSFSKGLASKMIKFIYGLSILYAGLLSFLCVALGFNVSKGLGILTLVLVAPLIFLLTLLYSRLLLEMFTVILRIAHHMAEIAKRPESREGIQWNI